jgi:non-ribosomal peptide synthetase component F
MNTKKTPSHMPIGQIAVNYQIHGPVPVYTTSDFVINNIETDDIPTAADLQLEALETPDHSLDLRIDYSTALYHDADMERFIDNFLAFLNSSIKDYRQPVEEINMCGPLEIAALEKQYWNTETSENQWEGDSVLDKVTQMARRHPQAVAIKASDGHSISYKQLIDNAESVAYELQQAGVKPREQIALLALPGVEAVTGMLGALMSGSSYFALDTDFALERLSFMIADAKARVLLVGSGAEALAGDLIAKAAVRARVIVIREAVASARHPTQLRRRQPQDPFYMIYTSVRPFSPSASESRN